MATIPFGTAFPSFGQQIVTSRNNSLTIAPELEIVWILAEATVGIRLEAGRFLAASTKTIEQMTLDGFVT